MIARKGRKAVPHFAHEGKTCNPTQRDQDVITLPVYDQFDLGIKPALLRILHQWPQVSMSDSGQLKRAGLVENNDGQPTHQLTRQGQLVTGELPLAAFADEQDRLMLEKHDQLHAVIKSSLPGPDHDLALADLRLFRVQWQRVLSATLYFLEIKHQRGTVYKIGVTTRPLDERIAEIEQNLQIWLSDYPTIKPLRTLSHQGAMEYYFIHRYRAFQTPIGRHTAYFTFKSRRNVLNDLTRLKNRKLTDFDRAILDGDPPPVAHELHKIPVIKPEPVTLVVYDDRRPVYTRKVDLKEYTITCQQCGQTVTLWRYPGRTPSLCSEECKRTYERAKTRERVRKHRQQKRKSTR